MSIQTIIDQATFITFNYKDVASQSVSRSGRLLTAEVVSAVPFRLTVGFHDGLKYSENRGLIAAIDALDVTTEAEINIGATNANLSYITAYQGDIPDPTDIIYNSHTGDDGKSVHINTTSTGGGTGNIFKAGDFISAESPYRYAYIVTQDVPWSNSSNITVPVHRSFIPQDSYTISGKDMKVGNNIRFNVKLLSKPTYSILPHDRLVFNSDFEFIENIRKEDG